MRSPVTAGQPCERCGGFAQIMGAIGAYPGRSPAALAGK